jgi:hypothetical protein
MSIWDYIHKYAPAKDKNDPVKYTNDMVNRFNQAIGSNVITKDTSLGELKEALIEAGLDPEHTITRAHLQTEDPSVLKDLDIVYGKAAVDSNPMPPVRKSTVTEKKKEEPKVARPAPKEEAAFDLQNVFPTPNLYPPSPLIRKPESKVQPTIPPRTIVKKPTVVTPVQEPSVLESVSSGISNVASNIYKGASTFTTDVNNSYEGLKAVIKQEASSKLQSGIKGVGAISNELYDAITNTFGGSSEDLKNVFNAMENGASLDDLTIMAKSFMSKATGIGTEDLVGKSGSLSATKDAAEVLGNWATPFNKGKENMVKKKYIVDDKQISDTPAVVQGDYTSKAFVLNLKSSKNKFGVLDNIHAGSGVGNLNTFFNNFTPVNGSMVFTAQNDVNDTRTMPLTKIQQGDDWYRDFKYLMRLNNGTLEVVKGKDIKPGDNIFKTANKIFSMDDFDIRDGKINTVYMSGITASIPITKKTTQNNTKKEYTGYKNGFVIGLTNKYQGGMIPIAECDQYGQSKGGSYVIFSEDLEQQYMVGGSFKNLYETYEKLKNQNPNKKFQIISSDTGTYSNSIFPNSGKIDGNVYRQSCFRNSYGHVQYMILMNN